MGSSMEKMNPVRKGIVADVRGSNFVEYIIIACGVALACVVAFQYFGGKVDAKIRQAGDGVANIGVTPAATK